MATRLDFDIIKIIKFTKRRSKVKSSDIPYELSEDEYYVNAIKWIMRAGSFGFISIALILILFLSIVLYAISNGADSDMTWRTVLNIVPLALIVFTSIAFLSYKIRSLEVTPTFVLVSLIVNLVLWLLLIFSFFPIIPIIINIIALIKWHTYKSWFYDIDVDYYKRKARGVKTKV